MRGRARHDRRGRDGRRERGRRNGDDGDKGAVAETVVTPPPEPKAFEPLTFDAVWSPLSAITGGGTLRLVVEGWRPFDVPTDSAHVVDLTVPAGARVTFEAAPWAAVPAGTRVRFLIDGVNVWSEGVAPYFLYGNDGDVIRYWPAARVIWGRAFTLEVAAGAARFAARLRLWTV